MQRQRISNITAILMIIFAVIVDVCEIALEWAGVGFIADWFIDPFILAILWFWCWRLGVSFTGTRALVYSGLGFLSLFPGLDEVMWVIDVVIVITLTRAEDKTHLSAQALINSPATQALLKRSIMKNVNQAAANNPLLKQKLAKQTERMNEGLNPDAGQKNTIRIANAPDPRLEAQRQDKIQKNIIQGDFGGNTGREHQTNNEEKKAA